MKTHALRKPKPPEKPPAETPYLSARREWNERYGSYIARANAWRLTALSSLAIAALAVGGVVWIGSQNRLVPYVVETNKLGDAVGVRRADQIYVPNERVIRAQLARWVSNIRSVYVDAAAERALIDEAFAMLNKRGAAYPQILEHFRANDPFKRAESETVTVEVQSVLPISQDTWRVEWRESVMNRDGSVKQLPVSWQATVTISIAPPATEQAILMNPMGVYVNSYSWSQRLI
ncbi:conjugal transfer protein TrbF [Azospirillum sp. CT11-132]|uniref:conjugal transfer protein TrbF n=1 Tax=Azospirillum sp. CT11-132 TaxID=3396317 RepID=UPI0039A5C9EC